MLLEQRLGIAQHRASRKLARNLKKAKIPRPQGYVVHHIAVVGAFGNRATADAVRRVQDKLASLGIGPNDVANGVYLPAKYHSPLHTNAYLREVDRRLADSANSEEGARNPPRHQRRAQGLRAHPANCKFRH